ncbi:hypothetical protein BMF38_06500 [Comamonas kerstersii]|nr:hypothetical protein BMF38_06500 [Comamonas kerstersii]
MAHVNRCIVAQHDDFLLGATALAGCHDTQTTALAQKQVNHGQIPLIVRIGQPGRALCFGFCETHWFDIGQLKQGVDEVFANCGVIFHKESFKFHGLAKASREWSIFGQKVIVHRSEGG